MRIYGLEVVQPRVKRTLGQHGAALTYTPRTHADKLHTQQALAQTLPLVSPWNCLGYVHGTQAKDPASLGVSLKSTEHEACQNLTRGALQKPPTLVCVSVPTKWWDSIGISVRRHAAFLDPRPTTALLLLLLSVCALALTWGLQRRW